MFRVAIKMLAAKPARLLFTSAGMAALCFVSLAQVGMMVGWVSTIAGIINHAHVDLWVMAEQTPAFDYGTPIPRQRLYQVRSIEGVGWAEAMVMEWAFWQRPDGRRVNVELIGLDKANVGGPWSMHAGDVEQVHLPESVIVDEMFTSQLGVNAVGDEAEILGKRAVVRGLSRRVRTFTAAPFVFTSIRSAIAFDRRNREDEVTYVMARCMPGESPDEVAHRIREEVPHIEVLTSREFAWRSVSYWMLGTGIGVTVVLTAVLGVLVSAMVGSQTLFGITNDHLANYATLLAVGFSRWQLIACVLVQGLVLTGAGALLGSATFLAAARASERSPIPLQMIWQVYLAMLGVSILANLAGALLSVKAVLRIDPVVVLRA